jgi:hypothetical protein
VQEPVLGRQLDVGRPGDRVAAAAVVVERRQQGELQVLGRAIVDVDAGLAGGVAGRLYAVEEQTIFPMAGVGRLGVVGCIGRPGKRRRGESKARRGQEDRRPKRQTATSTA